MTVVSVWRMKRLGRECGATGGRVELAPVARWVREEEAAGSLEALLEPFEAGHDGGDVVPHRGVVGFVGPPRELWAEPLTDAGHDRDLRTEVVAGRSEDAGRAVHGTERVLHRHRLRAGRLSVDLRAAEGWKDEGDLAGHEVRAVELGRHVNGEPAMREPLFGRCRVGQRTRQVAAEAHHHARFAVAHRADGGDRVVPARPWRLEREAVA